MEREMRRTRESFARTLRRIAGKIERHRRFRVVSYDDFLFKECEVAQAEDGYSNWPAAQSAWSCPADDTPEGYKKPLRGNHRGSRGEVIDQQDLAGRGSCLFPH